MKPAIIFFLICILFSCNSGGNQASEEQLVFYPVDSSRIEFVSFDSVANLVKKEGEHAAVLSPEDMQLAENLLNHFIFEYNKEQEEKYKTFNKNHPGAYSNINDFLIELEDFKRQYIAYFNKKNDKNLFVNCNSYFSRGGWFCLRINLKTRDCYSFDTDRYRL